MSTRRHRSRAIADQLIALSLAYERHNLAARGLGLEHLRELLVRLVRPLVRQGASLAFGGFWKKTDDNFTYDLLALISAEQEESTLGGPDTSLNIGRLINHSAWPLYLEITAGTEAQWINCCRIVRVTQQEAGIAPADIVPDAEAGSGSDRAVFNAAVTLSAMRRLVMEGMQIPIPDAGTDDVPPAIARVVLGGKVRGYRGFVPGIFEEALLTLEKQRPLYVLGGFGGAAEVLAEALLAGAGTRPQELFAEWHRETTPEVARLAALAAQFPMPPAVRTTDLALEALFAWIEQARADLPGTLRTGLDLAETRELLTTRDVARAVQLVRKGLESQIGLQALPA
jgi:SLOG cluster2